MPKETSHKFSFPKDGSVKLVEIVDDKPTAKERQKMEMEISQIRTFRKDAAKIYKFDPRPGQMLHAIRKRYFQQNEFEFSYYMLKNTKYNVSIEYNSKNRRGVLYSYQQRIRNVRHDLKTYELQLSKTGWDEVAKIHYTSNGVINWFYQKMLSEAKRPTSIKRHIGIEIECGIPKNADYSVFRACAKKISIVGDGSINQLSKNYKPQEIRLLTTLDDYQSDVEGIIKILNDIKAEVNETCGLHVHLDMRNTDKEIVSRRFHNLVRSQKYLQGLVDEKRKKNHFCKPTRAGDPFIMHDRYHAINGAALHEHNTLEIRLHHGTLNAEEIIQWVELLHTIMDADRIERCPRTLESFMKKIDVKASVKQYLQTKYKPVVMVQPASLPCNLEHETETCLDCGNSWYENHDGHHCLNEDGDQTGDRGRFTTCVERTATIEEESEVTENV